MCVGPFASKPKTPDVAPPTPPPPTAPVQKLEPTKPPTATPAPEQATQEKAALKKKDTGRKKKQRMREGTASLQTAPGQGLNIGGGS
jgi:type IV secretory pathway VirB10-like protein